LPLAGRIVQSVLAPPPRPPRWHVAPVLLGRTPLPPGPAKRPPLLPLPGAPVPHISELRCLEGALVQGQRRHHALRRRRRHAGAAAQRRPARRLHARLPLVPPPDRRQARSPAAGAAAPAGPPLIEL